MLCLAVLMAVMAWISAKVLRLERENVVAQRSAALEETVRLALWRMDATISPLIVQESARPYFEYMSFNPAQTVFPNILANDNQAGLVPSPLLLEAPTNVMVYFNGYYAVGKGLQDVTSPQVPTGDMAQLAINNYRIAPLIGGNTARFNEFNDNVSIGEVRDALSADMADDVARVQVNNVAQQYDVAVNVSGQPQVLDQPQQKLEIQQQARNVDEFVARKGQYTKAASKGMAYKQQRYNPKNVQLVEDAQQGGQVMLQEPQPQGAAPFPEVDETVMRPVWVRDFLVLARSVSVDGRKYVQGAWLDWAGIKRELLDGIRDILPEAGLTPARPGDDVSRSRMMASLPVQLVPGKPADEPAVAASPLRLPLMLAWACFVLAAGAVGILLVGAVSLSERRAAFVSAVTHELRTPLTTFRMYSEMLAEGMIEEEEKRRRYLNTLCAEGSRLSHLVENVLSYARLERGGRKSRIETVEIGELIERTRSRLAQRAEQAGMELDVAPDAGSLSAGADVPAVEQILFNLVDNACKYAAQAEDRRIHVEVEQRGDRAVLRVRDHGPGIANGEAHRLFKPFRKSAKHAAETAPGVGLGLALSLRLARQMGGNLRIDTTRSDGAAFELLLPVEPLST